MKIEVGKSYMTRDGRRADVTGLGIDPVYVFIGYVVSSGLVNWTEDGHWIHSSPCENLDLVAPWRDKTDVEPETPAAETTPEITKQSVLEEAIATVAGRGKSYGRPEDNFERIARLWTAHLTNRYGDYDIDLDPQDVAMMMTLMKIARLQNDPNHHDSWVDVAGYGACGGEIAGRFCQE